MEYYLTYSTTDVGDMILVILFSNGGDGGSDMYICIHSLKNYMDDIFCLKLTQVILFFGSSSICFVNHLQLLLLFCVT